MTEDWKRDEIPLIQTPQILNQLNLLTIIIQNVLVHNLSSLNNSQNRSFQLCKITPSQLNLTNFTNLTILKTYKLWFLILSTILTQLSAALVDLTLTLLTLTRLAEGVEGSLTAPVLVVQVFWYVVGEFKLNSSHLSNSVLSNSTLTISLSRKNRAWSPVSKQLFAVQSEQSHLEYSIPIYLLYPGD